MDKPLVTIVIPLYNGADYIRQSIESALGQTWSNLEVIVVNDGSADGGAGEKIALEYGDRIRYFSKDNGGVSSALNYGIRKMRGDWFSWLSHDDLYLPDKIEKEMECLGRAVRSGLTGGTDKTAVYCGTELIDGEGRVLARLKPASRPDDGPMEVMLKNLRKNRLGGCSFLIPKVCFEELGMFQGEIRTVSDYDFWYRMLLAGWRLLYVPEYLVQGRVHPGQVTYRMSGLAEKEFDEFHYQLCRSLYFEKGVRSWKTYWFIGRCALKRGFTGSASLAFHLASDNMPSIFYRLMYLFTRLECFFARRIKSLAKSLFSRLK